MSATATLDPAATIAAAVRELYDQLVDLIGRGPTDDPSLLDELAALTRPVRARITRARKRAEVAEGPRVVEPVPTPAAEPASPAMPAPTAAVPTAPAVAPTIAPATAPTATVPAPAPAVPARTTPAAGERVTVRLTEPRLPAVAPAPAPAAASPRRGRHRKQVSYVAHRTAHTTWKGLRGAVAGLAIGTIGALGGRGLAESGAHPALIWAWGIVFFAAFVGGLCFWAVSASKRWGQEVAAIVDEPAADEQPADEEPTQLISFEDESDRAYREYLELHQPTGGAE